MKNDRPPGSTIIRKVSLALTIATIFTFAACIFTFVDIAVSPQFNGANIGGGMLYFLGIVLGIFSVLTQPPDRMFKSVIILVISAIAIWYLIGYISSLNTIGPYKLTQ